MELAHTAPGPKTSIPPRFQRQRERVLRILARWESSTRFAPNPTTAVGLPMLPLRG